MNSVVKLLIEIAGEVGSAVVFVAGLRALALSVVTEVTSTSPEERGKINNLIIKAMVFIAIAFSFLIHTRL
jgi:hypothetical protein